MFQCSNTQLPQTQDCQQCICLIDATCRCELVHYLFLTCDCSDRQAVTKCLCKCTRSGMSPKNSLAPSARRKPVTTSSNIKIISFCSVIFLTSLRYPFFWQHKPNVCKHRFHYDTGSVTVLFNWRLKLSRHVVWHNFRLRTLFKHSSDAGMLAIPDPALTRT